MQNIEKNVAEAMNKIIKRFKQTPDNFCCGEYDALGMYNFLKKKEANLCEHWSKAFEDVKTEIELIKGHVFELKKVA
ncbi:MAG: hypothetical protein WC872_04150 [Candidatus Absconditabacterales bacterium]